jgi:hypothetical protein
VKTCTKCRTVKPLSEFHRDSRKSDGRRSRCKVCFNADQLAFQRRHKAETGQYYSRKYTYTRVCEVCGKTWQAKSSKARYCSTACTNKIPSYERTCEACGTVWLATQARARWCSTECSNGARYGWPTCRIPADHPVRAVPSPKLYRVYFPDCRWCGTKFTTQQPAHQLCSKYCVRREARARRKAREHRATGAYTWTEVIGLFLAFGRCCAYCSQPVDGTLEPDHVVPLSKGGSNSITNILPACKACNGDKRDLLLDEWALDRLRRGLPPRRTTWTRGDPRYRHLTIVQTHEKVA